MDQVQTYIQPALDTLKNPYVVGVLGILAIVYGSLMAPQLPPSVASWFANPIFKVLFIFLILAVRNINPTVAILLTLGLIISMQTLNRYRVFTMANEVSQITAQKPTGPLPPTPPQFQPIARPQYQQPTADENQQMSLEVAEEMKRQQEIAKQNEMLGRQQNPGVETYAQQENEEKQENDESGVPDAEKRPVDALHPMNRPTWETAALTPRVEDPDDPRNPGWKALYGPNVDVSIYELNPPFLRKNLPNQFVNPRGAVKADGPQIYPPQYGDKLPRVAPPQKGPSRYSAYHGYPAVPSQSAGASNYPADPRMRKNLRDIDDNMPSPIIPQDQQILPNSFLGENPALPNYGNRGMDVAAKLNPGNDNYSGSQGLMWQPGYPGSRSGAIYATQNSEL